MLDKELQKILKGPQVPMAGRKGLTGEIVGFVKVTNKDTVTVVADPIMEDSAATPNVVILLSNSCIPCSIADMKTSDAVYELGLMFGELSRQLRKKSFEMREEGR